jgi:hypothetical protein
MSNYTKTTDFEAKDSLPTGDSGKIIRGAEFETEFDAISTAIATKADTAGPTFTGTLTFETISDGTIGVTAFVDEDDMSSDSATLVPTQQSVKAYVDSQVTAQDLDFQADTGGALSIDLDSETLTFTGGTGIDTSGALNAVTFAIDSTVATLTGSQTLTNKTLTSPVLNTGVSGTAVLDEDDMSSNSATQLATQQSIKAYVDSQVGANNELSEILANGNTTGGTNIVFGDSASVSDDRLVFGDGSDLQIYHSGTHSYIDDAGTGNLTLRGNASVRVEKYEGEILADFAADGAVSLYHDNSVKIATSSTGVSVTGNITVDGTVDGRDIATDGTKLDGIESGATADQTAAEIRTLVEAATDSNVFTDADHTKLDGIEAGATGDQTNAEIRAAVEAATDSNVFTDADHSKLDGIEAGADVTDTVNVTAAGAVMDSELTNETAVKALDQGVATTDSPTFDGLTIDSSDVTLATIQRDGGGSPGSFGGYNIKFNAANSTTGDDYYLGINLGGQFSLSTDSSFLSSIFDITSTGINVNTNINFGDNDKAVFGAGSDLQIYHSGTGSYIEENGTGNLFIEATNLRIKSASGENYIAADQDGAVTAYYDNTARLATTSTGVDVTGVITTDGMTTSADINFGDNDKAVFGAGSDLQIYHDGSTSFIRDSGTGDLQIRASNLLLTDVDGTIMLDGRDNGKVSLHHNGSEKLTTTSTGIDVTGTVTADDAVYVEGSSPRLQLQDTDGTAQLSFFQQAGEDLVLRLRNNTADGGFTVAGYGGASTTNRFYVNPNGDISFYEDTGTTAKLFWDASAESLGIGTTTPNYLLDVEGSGALFRINSTSGDATAQLSVADTTSLNTINFGDSGSTTAGQILYRHNGDSMAFNVGGAEAIRILNGGNVGIGTTSPVKQLTLASANTSTVVATALNHGASNYWGIGSYTDQSFRIAKSHGLEDANTYFAIERSSGNVGIGTSSPESGLHLFDGTNVNAPQNANRKATLTIEAGSEGSADIQMLNASYNHIFFGDAADANVGYFLYDHTNNSMQFATNAAERMRIDASGNVGIGASSPITSLTLGTGTTGVSFQSSLSTFNSGKIAVVKPLEVGSGNGHLVFETYGGGAGGGERMRIDSSGNLLVGTTDSSVYNNSGSGTGINLQNFGNIAVARDGNDCMVLNRLNSDGAIANFAKDGTTVGSIGARAGDLTIGTGNCGLIFNDGTEIIIPANITTNAVSDAAVDLGYSAGRFRNLYLSNQVFADYIGASDDTNTTISFPGSDQIRFNNGGSETARIDASGNLLVGTTDTTLYNNTTGGGAMLSNSGCGFAKETSGTGDPVAYFNNTGDDGQILDFRKDGTTVGSIGTKLSSIYLANGDVSLMPYGTGDAVLPRNGTGGSRDAAIDFGDATNRFKDLYLSGKVHLQYPGNSYYAKVEVDSSTNLILGAGPNGAERARIDSSGRFFIGLTAVPTANEGGLYMDAVGLVMSSRNGTSLKYHYQFLNDNGVVGSISTTGSATAFNTSSDQRLKENIVDAPSASDDIDAIQVRSFDWKADGSHQKYGMVAQELQSVAPEAVTGDADSDDMMGVDYSKLVPMLVKEIQSLRARVAQLEGEN